MDVSFTEDYGLYVVGMHINSAVNTVVTAVSCFALDFFMDLFFIPVTVQPILGGCSLGLLKPIGYMATVINWQLFGLFLGMSGMSLLYAMMYRAASVYNKAHILTKKPVIILMAFVQIFYSSPSIILVLSVYPGNEKSIEYIRQMVIPTGMISVSYIAFAVAGGLQLKSARIVSFCTFLFSTFHTTANGAIMIATIKPYRLAFLRYLRTFIPLHKFYKGTSSTSHIAIQSREPTFTVSRISRVSSISVQ
ncbi:serpentine type 7TM GPCR chemoreceptor srh domain-containing protein [Ditylenchus destructor]|uniref:Serpentine type 7TM GPCR chemoreceptor srh domain-containing protein n=1 Tax=Ditylenchus destructor TaxID=166010 RepID=A0AAD4N3I6_9BILA|nr:serpentine type 7TM GPCR chemoreceptor srh domain-containing protein [Ditylenchus destructor]